MHSSLSKFSLQSYSLKKGEFRSLVLHYIEHNVEDWTIPDALADPLSIPYHGLQAS